VEWLLPNQFKEHLHWLSMVRTGPNERSVRTMGSKPVRTQTHSVVMHPMGTPGSHSVVMHPMGTPGSHWFAPLKAVFWLWG